MKEDIRSKREKKHIKLNHKQTMCKPHNTVESKMVR